MNEAEVFKKALIAVYAEYYGEDLMGRALEYLDDPDLFPSIEPGEVDLNTSLSEQEKFWFALDNSVSLTLCKPEMVREIGLRNSMLTACKLEVMRSVLWVHLRANHVDTMGKAIGIRKGFQIVELSKDDKS